MGGSPQGKLHVAEAPWGRVCLQVEIPTEGLSVVFSGLSPGDKCSVTLWHAARCGLWRPSGGTLTWGHIPVAPGCVGCVILNK